MKEKIIVIAGPTASGKSRVAVECALALNGEIVSCDSMQIYRKMDIGTAKIGQDEMRGVRHHMLDLIDPDESFSCADFVARARKEIRMIREHGRLPIICGGTGLYADSLLYGEYASPPADENLRKELGARGADENYAELCRIDPEAAQSIHPNNVKRVIRALEIYRLSGIPKSTWDKRQKRREPAYDMLYFALIPSDRQQLYELIDRRVDAMIDAGLEREVRGIGQMLQKGQTAAQAIGYKEFLKYFRGEMSLEETVCEIKQASRNYAKRQLTWFSGREDIICLDIRCGETDEVVGTICRYAEERGYTARG